MEYLIVIKFGNKNQLLTTHKLDFID